MKLFVKPLEKDKVDHIKRLFYRYESKGEMLQKILEHQEDGTNTEMFKLYSDSYEAAAADYKEAFMEFVSMLPDSIESVHDIHISVSFINNRLEVKQMCDCDIVDEMKLSGFECIV